MEAAPARMRERDAATLARLLDEARADPDVNAALLFGSAARGEGGRDVDVALVLRAGFVGDASGKTLKFAAFASGARHEGVDPSIFLALPVYVRAKVLRDAKVLLVKDEDELYAVAHKTAQEWDDHRRHHERYLEAIERGWA